MIKLFYYSDAVPFLTYGETAVEKLEENLELLRKQSDSVHLIWHLRNGTGDILRSNGSEVADRLEFIRSEYIRLGAGELNEDPEGSPGFYEAISGCDAYYGDPSDACCYAQLNGIPAMIQGFFK
ncbi:MAG: hypothetical protein K5840_08505 [Eubacterium sp.]|nr:hypothetical protein [Eubacterium sp.]